MKTVAKLDDEPVNQSAVSWSHVDRIRRPIFVQFDHKRPKPSSYEYPSTFGYRRQPLRDILTTAPYLHEDSLH